MTAKMTGCGVSTVAVRARMHEQSNNGDASMDCVDYSNI